MSVPTITSLVALHEPSNPVPPWKAPFIEFLGLLGIVNASKPNPQLDGQRFCFQPSLDLSEISRIFISVTTSSFKYDIDLKTIRLSNSGDVPPSVTKLQEYANHVLRRVQLFRDQLLKSDPTTDIARFLEVDLLTCPLCSSRLLSCINCDSVVACSGLSCQASLLIPCETCRMHDRMFCHACLEKNEVIPPLIKCPMCGEWCCREDTEWCNGLVRYPALDSEEMTELCCDSDWGSKTIVRSHRPKPDGCGFCVDHSLRPAPGWIMCNNGRRGSGMRCCPAQTPLMNKIRTYGAYCAECVAESPGRHCACGESWLCPTCVEMANYPYQIACPRCGVSYCTDHDQYCVQDIEMCWSCEGAIPCMSCQEEEALPGDVESATERAKEITFDGRCDQCRGWTCADCRTTPESAKCVVCLKWYCFGCVDDSDDPQVKRCAYCPAHACMSCMAHHHQTCPALVVMANTNYAVPPGMVIHSMW